MFKTLGETVHLKRMTGKSNSYWYISGEGGHVGITLVDISFHFKVKYAYARLFCSS